jgi:hypothetical protein
MHEHEFDDICEKLGFSCALEHFDTGDWDTMAKDFE